MRSGQFTHRTLRFLDRLAAKLHREFSSGPAHTRTGRSGEEQAYFYLRRLGYVMVARNFRSPHCRGEIDLIGWDQDVLCFIEVKTRSSREVKPAQTAVNRDKQQQIAATAREYLRRMPASCSWRVDVVSVYYEEAHPPVFELFRNALLPS
jgi:putative endonuclease